MGIFSNKNMKLLEAIEGGNLVEAKKYLNKKSDPNFYKEENGVTTLMIVSQGGYTDFVKALLDKVDKRANVNLQDKKGWSALLYAANKDIVKALLDKGADVNLQDENGRSALLYAAINSNEGIVKALLDKGADVNLQNKNGGNALIYAASNSNEGIVKALLDKGADVNLQNQYGGNALLYALSKDIPNEGIVKALLDKGADVNLQNRNGGHALLSALSKDYLNEGIVKALLDKGADVNLQDKDGSSALLIAHQKGHTSIADVLLDKGADVNLQNKKELTPLSAKDPAKIWFKSASNRGKPYDSQDFDIFKLPKYSLKEWCVHVASKPQEVKCTIVTIANLGTIVRTLFDILKKNYEINSREAVAIFNDYIAAACPKCLGGLTGTLLQTVETYKKSGSVVIMGNDDHLRRVLDGFCHNCEGKKYYIIWKGDQVTKRRRRMAEDICDECGKKDIRGSIPVTLEDERGNKKDKRLCEECFTNEYEKARRKRNL